LTPQMYIGGSGCAILRGQGLNRICAGQTSGQVYLLDSRTYRKEHTIEAHESSLSDLDVHGNLLVTCGFGSSRHGSCSLDRFLKIYDLRSLRALAPIQVSIDPIMLRYYLSKN
jgi:PAB-dependent poly(A)-specific ribonuclease subunit 2